MFRKDTARVAVGFAVGAVLPLIACTAPVVDGTPYGRDNSSIRSAGKDDGKSAAPPKRRNTNNAPSPLKNSEDDGSGATVSSGGPARPAPTATTAPTDTTPPPVVTAPPPVVTAPAPTTPNCASANPDACFNCCLGANPGAVNLESAYDQCLNNAFDPFEAQQCQNQHAAQCNGSTACRSHHACLSANGCLDSTS